MEVVQWLRACVTLLEDLSSVFSTGVRWLTAVCQSSCKGLNSLFWPSWALHSCVDIHPQTCTYSLKNKNHKTNKTDLWTKYRIPFICEYWGFDYQLLRLARAMKARGNRTWLAWKHLYPIIIFIITQCWYFLYPHPQDPRCSIQKMCQFLGKHSEPEKIDFMVKNSPFPVIEGSRISDHRERHEWHEQHYTFPPFLREGEYTIAE